MTGPEHYRQAECLTRQAAGLDPEGALVAAQLATAHATLALAAVAVDRLADSYIGDGDHINQWRRATGIAPTAPQLESAPAVAYVYRADWGMTPLGTYTNEAAARRHCEADATNHADNPTGLSFDWIGDESEPDGPCELVITGGGPADEPTDYTVTRIEVATEYDAEADA